MADSPASKPEFPPLIPPGLYNHTVAQLRVMCVDGFPLSETRAAIMDGFDRVVTALRAANVIGDLWVDGSFVTKKINPADVDVVLLVAGDLFDNGTEDQKAAIRWISSNVMTTHKCHSFVIPLRPDGHPEYWLSQYMYSYWIKQFGFSRSMNMKGIAVVSL